MSDRELLAAAAAAPASARSGTAASTPATAPASEIDIAQRFPTPFRDDVLARSAGDRPRPGLRLRPDPPGVALRHRRALERRRLGPDAADAGHRALDGARRSACRYTPEQITDRDTNLQPRHRLPEAGARRLRRLAGDGRRGLQRRPGPAAHAGAKGPVLEPAVWAENIPFNETRDYVKKVLSQRHLLRDGCSAARARRPLAPRPAGRPARPERAAGRQRSCPDAGAPASARIAVRRPRPSTLLVMHRNFLILGGTGFVGRSVAEKLVERGGGAGGRIRVATRRAAHGPGRCSCCRRSRSRRPTSTTRRRWRGCCAAPTRSSTWSRSCTAARTSSSATHVRAAAPTRRRLPGGRRAARRPRQRARRRRPTRRAATCAPRAAAKRR